jgi:putative photosynthetic complex assembly protein 2
MMIAAAIAFVVVLWALSTAAIFYLDSLPPRTFPISFTVVTLLSAAALYLVWRLRGSDSTLATLTSFACCIVVWGWTEMGLYMGYITGPRKQRCPHGCKGRAHFLHAVQANLWHELVVIVLVALLWFLANTTAFWCFTLLWLMHLSARLNVFLGVRNVSEEFVPKHMDVLKGFLRKRAMNLLFPFSCGIMALTFFWVLQQPYTLFTTLTATLVAIGFVEHILLVLPLPIERLWHWSLSKPSRPEQDPLSNPNADYTMRVSP